MTADANTILLILSNALILLLGTQISEFKAYAKETRQKLDNHVESKSAHCDVYKAKVLHQNGNQSYSKT